MTTTESDWEDAEPEEHIDDESYISDETRREVLMRDQWKCRHCGEDDIGTLTLHHVRYRSQGGGHHADNLVTLCWFCHRKIHDKVLRVVRIAGKWFFSERFGWRTKLRR